MKTLTATKEPKLALQLLAYNGQDPKRRQYREGYEQFFNMLPYLSDNDQFLDMKVNTSREVVQKLADLLRNEAWLKEGYLSSEGFERFILGMEHPINYVAGGYKEGAELVVARWGDNHSSPVHGHASGYLHEEILFGKMRVNTYRMIDHNLVRPLGTEIAKAGTFASQHNKEAQKGPKRQALIHNFTSIGFSATLHYLPEHTRDGRDNTFKVERFNDTAQLTEQDVTRLTGHEAFYSQPGDVIIVRSTNVPEYGDHYIIITGGPVIKEHGMRPQDHSIYASDASSLLDKFPLRTGLTLLKLNEDKKQEFLSFHGIIVEKGKVIFPGV